MKVGNSQTATRNGVTPVSSESFYKAHTELLEMVAEEEPLSRIFERATMLIEEVSPVETWCTLKLVERPEKSLCLVAAPSLPAPFIEELENIKVAAGEGTCGQAVVRRESVVSEDVATDPENVAYHGIARDYGVKSCWSVPVLDKSGESLGVFTSFYRIRHRPAGAWLRKIESMCQLVRIAIERQEASKALVSSNEKFKSAAAATNDAVWDWDIVKGTLWWNEGFSKLFGFEGKGLRRPSTGGWTGCTRMTGNAPDPACKPRAKAPRDAGPANTVSSAPTVPTPMSSIRRRSFSMPGEKPSA